MSFIQKIIDLLTSELVIVELVSLGFVTILLAVLYLFNVNLRRYLYPSLLILIVFPALWFFGKWIVGLIKQIDLSGIPTWVWIVIGVILFLLIFGKFIFSKVTVPKWNWTKAIAWTIVIAFIVFFTWPSIRPYLNWHWNVNYPEVSLNGNNDFTAGKKKSFEIKNFGDPMYPYPIGTTDTITFTCDGPSGSWKYKTWTSKGFVGYEQIIGQQSLIAGKHTIKTDKDCTLFIATTAPTLLNK